ncbi:MAG TPA: cytochrome P450 [Polyangium sp.]|nr:cytochrome P450 [Polyangium sp.]
MTLQIDLADRAVRANPYPLYAKLRKEAPVLRTQVPAVGPAWILARYADVSEALKDPRLLNDRMRAQSKKSPLDRWWMPRIVRAFETSMVAQDDPNHRRLRNLVHMAFTPKMIEQLSARVTEITNNLLDNAEKRGSIDLLDAFALPLPLTIISEMMGVPEKDRLPFRDMIAGMLNNTSALEGSFIGTARMLPTMMRLTRFFQNLVKLRRAEPGDDLTSRLIQARAEGHAQLTEDEIAAMLFLLLFAGHETTVNLIGNGTLALLENPGQLALLREKPELIGSAVEELLRYSNPVEQPSPRWTSEEMTYQGVKIPKGEAIMSLIASANRDEDAFERADELDITRNPNRHVAFGLGVHYCLGAPLARLEGKIAILSLVQRFPKLRLAVPPETLKWRPTPSLHGLEALPVHLS